MNPALNAYLASTILDDRIHQAENDRIARRSMHLRDEASRGSVAGSGTPVRRFLRAVTQPLRS
jgi:hypothetical protein